MRAARRERDERLGVTGHTTTEWDDHYDAYQRHVLPLREHANIVITLREPDPNEAVESDSPLVAGGRR